VSLVDSTLAGPRATP